MAGATREAAVAAGEVAEAAGAAAEAEVGSSKRRWRSHYWKSGQVVARRVFRLRHREWAPRSRGPNLPSALPEGRPSRNMRRHLAKWRRIGANAWVLETLARGIHLPWVTTPPRHRARGYDVPAADMDFLTAELQRGLQLRFNRELSPVEAAKAYCVVEAFVTGSAGKPLLVIYYSQTSTCHQEVSCTSPCKIWHPSCGQETLSFPGTSKTLSTTCN